MDKDRINGTVQKIKGGIRKTVGRLIGNKKMEAEGTVEEAAGNVRKVVGEAKDTVRDAIKDRTK